MNKTVLSHNKHFYSHIVDMEYLIDALEDFGLNKDELNSLTKLANDNLHHTILDLILSELSENDKKTFLLHFSNDNHEDIWNLLFIKVEKIEEKIRKAADEVRRELHEDIKKLKEYNKN
ncbi:MAG: hypothetical protein EXS44_00235 [Candidatus Levybacteria bacterium]|nr:hypothetical protein [Candidatus Levybacteria bacterium]